MAQLTFLFGRASCLLLFIGVMSANALKKPGYDCTVKGRTFVFKNTKWSCEKFCPQFPDCVEQCCEKIQKVVQRKPTKRPSAGPKQKTKQKKKMGKATSELLAIPTIAVALLGAGGIFLLTKKLVKKMHIRRMRNASASHSNGVIEIAPLREEMGNSLNSLDAHSSGDDESAPLRQDQTDMIEISEEGNTMSHQNQLGPEAVENDTCICTQVEDGEDKHFKVHLHQRGHSCTQVASASKDMKFVGVEIVETTL